MLTPGPTVAATPPAEGPLSVPMSLNPAPGRHSAAVAALESRAAMESRVATESAAQARGALARAAVDRSRQDHPVEQIAYRPAQSATAAYGPGAASLLGARHSLAGAFGARGGNAVAAALNGRAAARDGISSPTRSGTVDGPSSFEGHDLL